METSPTNELDPQAPQSPVMEYAERRLDSIATANQPADFNPVTSDALLGMKKLLADVTCADTVFPYIEADPDGALYARWHAIDRHLIITVAPDGAAQAYGVNGENQPSRLAEINDAAIDHLRLTVEAMSAVVIGKNPNWRDLFKDL